MPTLHNVPIGFANQAFIIVSQEEIEYQDGNVQEDFKFEDCFSCEELSSLAINCDYKRLPVIVQMYYEEQPVQGFIMELNIIACQMSFGR